jgi:hypothetical protein
VLSEQDKLSQVVKERGELELRELHLKDKLA